MQILHFVLQLAQFGLQLVGINGSTAATGKSGEHGALLGMVADTAAATAALVGGAAFTQRSSIMAGDAECGRRRAGNLPGIGGGIVSPCVISYIIGVVRLLGMGVDIVLQVIGIVDFLMVAIGIVLRQTGIHLRHEGVPVHAVTVEDFLIDFFLDVPRLGDLDAIGVGLGILAALFLAQDIG